MASDFRDMHRQKLSRAKSGATKRRTINPLDWRRLCGLAVQLVGGQDAFRPEARILQRLVRAYGADRTEYMILGAQRIGWRSLRSLGSRDGLGRRLAEAAYWQNQNSRRTKQPQHIANIFAELTRRGLQTTD